MFRQLLFRIFLRIVLISAAGIWVYLFVASGSAADILPTPADVGRHVRQMVSNAAEEMDEKPTDFVRERPREKVRNSM